MAKKPTISTISSGYASNTQLNNNFSALRTGFDNTLSLDGSTPNAMNADFDMNSNDILNANEINTSSLRLNGVLVSASGEVDVTSSIMSSDVFTGNGSTTVYTLSFAPFIKDNTQIYIDGVYQNKITYSTSGNTLTFTEAPPLNSAIEVMTARILTDVGTADAGAVTYTQGASGSVQTTVQAKLQESVSVKDFGATGDGVTDDTAAIQAAIDAASTIFVPSGTYKISSAIEVNDKTILFDDHAATLYVSGDHDGIILTGTTRPMILGGPNIVFSKTQTAGKAGIRLGNASTATQCAHFVIDSPTFEVDGGSGRTEADGIVFADNGSNTGYAFIGEIRAPKFRNLNRGIYGVYAVNAVTITQASTHRCKNPWKIGDARSVFISNAEFGGNFARSIDFGDCFGVTLDTPYFEDNCADNGGHTLPSIKAEIYVSGRTSEGFRRDNAGSGITIINPSFLKQSANCQVDYPVYVENGKNVQIIGGHTAATSSTNYANGITYTDNSNNSGVILDFVRDATGSGTTPAPSIGASAEVAVGTRTITSLQGSTTYDVKASTSLPPLALAQVNCSMTMKRGRGCFRWWRRLLQLTGQTEPTQSQ
jgi:hypothetical protein